MHKLVRKLALLAGAVLLAAFSAHAGDQGRLGIGRPATTEELARYAAFSVRPDGNGLPAGRGTAVEGKGVYTKTCAKCHGPTGKEGGKTGNRPTPPLVDTRPFKVGLTNATVGNYWPYSTTIWDYIHRAMPFDHPGTLSNDQIYAVTAYLLYANGLIGERDVVDPYSLPKVRMPNRDAFVPDPRPDVP
jgi:cytochrome c